MKRSRFPLSRIALVCALLVVTVGVAACGSSGSDKSSKSKKNGTTTTTFTFSGDNSTAFCAQLKTFSKTYADVVAPGTPEELKTRWAALTDGVKQLESAAPDEIKASLTTLRERIEGLTPALEGVGYVLNNVPQADREHFQDAAAQQATDKISAYGTQVCEKRSGK